MGLSSPEDTPNSESAKTGLKTHFVLGISLAFSTGSTEVLT